MMRKASKEVVRSQLSVSSLQSSVLSSEYPWSATSFRVPAIHPQQSAVSRHKCVILLRF